MAANQKKKGTKNNFFFCISHCSFSKTTSTNAFHLTFLSNVCETNPFFLFSFFFFWPNMVFNLLLVKDSNSSTFQIFNFVFKENCSSNYLKIIKTVLKNKHILKQIVLETHKMALRWVGKVILEFRGVTGIFFWGGKVIFPDFFPDVKCFFPVENSHFGRPKTNFRHFQKWKAKKKKKMSPHLFSELFLLPFPIFHLPFTIFLLFFSIFTPFPFFPCLFFLDTSAKISRSEVSGGHCAPRLLRHCLS